MATFNLADLGMSLSTHYAEDIQGFFNKPLWTWPAWRTVVVDEEDPSDGPSDPLKPAPARCQGPST